MTYAVSVKGKMEFLLFQMETAAGKREDGCGGKDRLFLEVGGELDPDGHRLG